MHACTLERRAVESHACVESLGTSPPAQSGCCYTASHHAQRCFNARFSPLWYGSCNTIMLHINQNVNFQPCSFARPWRRALIFSSTVPVIFLLAGPHTCTPTNCHGEDPAAHGHWCAFTDLYHTIPYHIWFQGPLAYTCTPTNCHLVPGAPRAAAEPCFHAIHVANVGVV